MGQGLPARQPGQLSFLPEKHTDFVFTMLAEESGLRRRRTVLALFLAAILLGLAIALRARSQFGAAARRRHHRSTFLYVVINVAMVMGLIPVVGVPLPLISYGGTAMLTLVLSLGLLLSVDVHRHVPLPRFPVDL